MSLVRCEVSPENGRVVRVFRNDKTWLDCPDHLVKIMEKRDAVGDVRRQVFDRTWNEVEQVHECEHCGRTITWESFEMNEIQFKGKGGEQSIWNCEALCHDCHQGKPDSVHGNRRWQTAKLKGTQC